MILRSSEDWNIGAGAWFAGLFAEIFIERFHIGQAWALSPQINYLLRTTGMGVISKRGSIKDVPIQKSTDTWILHLFKMGCTIVWSERREGF